MSLPRSRPPRTSQFTFWTSPAGHKHAELLKTSASAREESFFPGMLGMPLGKAFAQWWPSLAAALFWSNCLSMSQYTRWNLAFLATDMAKVLAAKGLKRFSPSSASSASSPGFLAVWHRVLRVVSAAGVVVSGCLQELVRHWLPMWRNGRQAGPPDRCWELANWPGGPAQ